MASLIYDRYFFHLAKGEVNPSADTFKVALVTSAYAPNKGTDDNYGDLSHEIVGTGYTAGGAASAATVTLDAGAHRVDVSFAGVNWPASTITAARGAVIYKVGSDAAHSYLVAYADFGADKSDVAATFAVSFDTPLRIQN